MIRKGCALMVVLLLALAVGLFATCPKETDHRLAVMRLFSEVLQDKVQDRVGESQAGKWLKAAGIDLGNSQLLEAAGNMSSGVMVNNMLRVDDYYLFSVGKLRANGREYVVSVGLLNHVFTPSREMVSDVVDSYLRR